jgi:hypothetical protein
VSSAADLWHDVKIRQVSMDLGLFNRVGHFFEQLHTNMAEQLSAVIDDPAAPRRRAAAKASAYP